MSITSILTFCFSIGGLLGYGMILVVKSDFKRVVRVVDKFPTDEFDLNTKNGSYHIWKKDGWDELINQTVLEQDIQEFQIRRIPFPMQPLNKEMIISFKPAVHEITENTRFIRYALGDYLSKKLTIGNDILLIIADEKIPLRYHSGFYIFQINLKGKPSSSLNWCEEKEGTTVFYMTDLDGIEFSTTCTDIYTFKINTSYKTLRLNKYSHYIELYDDINLKKVRHRNCGYIQMNYFTIAFANTSQFSKGVNVHKFRPAIKHTHTFKSPWFYTIGKQFCLDVTFNAKYADINAEIIVSLEKEGSEKHQFGVIIPTEIGVQERQISISLPKEYNGLRVRIDITSNMVNKLPHEILRIANCTETEYRLISTHDDFIVFSHVEETKVLPAHDFL